MTVRAAPGWSEFADGILGLGFSSLVRALARQNLRVRVAACVCPPQSCVPTCITPFVDRLFAGAKVNQCWLAHT